VFADHHLIILHLIKQIIFWELSHPTWHLLRPCNGQTPRGFDEIKYLICFILSLRTSPEKSPPHLTFVCRQLYVMLAFSPPNDNDRLKYLHRQVLAIYTGIYIQTYIPIFICMERIKDCVGLRHECILDHTKASGE